MPGWAVWTVVGVSAWLLALLVIVRGFSLMRKFDESVSVEPAETGSTTDPAPGQDTLAAPAPFDRRRILVVDDDAGIRLLLRTTLGLDEFVVEEAASAEEAAHVAQFWSPDVVILDVGLPGMDGLRFCRELKRNPRHGAPFVMLLTGRETTGAAVEAAGADAVLRKPFSPLELVALLGRFDEPSPVDAGDPDMEQLVVYARDLNRLITLERSQRRLLQHSYRQTAIALADALEAKDPVTGLHALRVQRFAVELVPGVDQRLLGDRSIEYGFLLHDVGKLGVPDAILQKRGPLSGAERKIMEQHTLIGQAILAEVPLLKGQGLKVVRSHHERWDGTGYPDGLAGIQIPVGARIFALVDAIDAMTNERPYRRALTWEAAVDEVLAQAGRQFDPHVVRAFAQREERMRRVSEELAEAAA